MGGIRSLKRKRTAFRLLMGKPQSNRPPGRLRRRWEDNIKQDLKGIEREQRTSMGFVLS